MRQIHTESKKQRQCAVCGEPLKWWSAYKCVDCGHLLCSQHAVTFRHNQNSSVLYTHCLYCGNLYLLATQQRTAQSIAQPAAQPTEQPMTASPAPTYAETLHR